MSYCGCTCPSCGSQSPYGAQSLATPLVEGGGDHRNFQSQSPYGAQSLATLMVYPNDWLVIKKVAIPLRGSIPCNEEMRIIQALDALMRVAIPLRGSIPCNLHCSQRKTLRSAEVAIPLRGSIPCNGHVRRVEARKEGAVAIPLRGSIPCNRRQGRPPRGVGLVAIPLRGSIPCNMCLGLAAFPLGGLCRNPLTGLNPLQRAPRP